MRNRCNNPKCADFHSYGGRGIRVCERWDDFTKFLEDMGKRPSSKHSIDRFPDRDGNYEPGNCRWATSQEQGNNTRRTRFLTWGGKTMSTKQWAKEVGLNYWTLVDRLRKGWTVDEALSNPAQSNRYW